MLPRHRATVNTHNHVYGTYKNVNDNNNSTMGIMFALHAVNHANDSRTNAKCGPKTSKNGDKCH